jgi:hypothetical protein
MIRTSFGHCISAAPAALDRYLAASPAMSLAPVAPFAFGTANRLLLKFEVGEMDFVIFPGAYGDQAEACALPDLISNDHTFNL